MPVPRNHSAHLLLMAPLCTNLIRFPKMNLENLFRKGRRRSRKRCILTEVYIVGPRLCNHSRGCKSDSFPILMNGPRPTRFGGNALRKYQMPCSRCMKCVQWKECSLLHFLVIDLHTFRRHDRNRGAGRRAEDWRKGREKKDVNRDCSFPSGLHLFRHAWLTDASFCVSS